jgi:hypothetical protein
LVSPEQAQYMLTTLAGASLQDIKHKSNKPVGVHKAAHRRASASVRGPRRQLANALHRREQKDSEKISLIQ